MPSWPQAGRLVAWQDRTCTVRFYNWNRPLILIRINPLYIFIDLLDLLSDLPAVTTNSTVQSRTDVPKHWSITIGNHPLHHDGVTHIQSARRRPANCPTIPHPMDQNEWIYVFLPPVTRIVSPVTYANSGLATARTDFAASSGLPGRPSGISGYCGAVAAAAWLLRLSSCLPGIPSATLVPSGVVMKAPSSFAAVSRVVMWPKATVLARTPNAGPHSFAMVLVRPTRPALARA